MGSALGANRLAGATVRAGASSNVKPVCLDRRHRRTARCSSPRVKDRATAAANPQHTPQGWPPRSGLSSPRGGHFDVLPEAYAPNPFTSRVRAAASPVSERNARASQPDQIVDQYLDAFYRGDFETARTLLADDLSFTGPFVQVDGADRFVASAEGLRRIVRGHRTVRRWHDGDEVSTLYEMKLETPVGKGSVLVSEWNIVREGEVAMATLVFDTAEFKRLVPQAGTAPQP